MKILLIGINSKYIHPAYGIFQLVANTPYPVSHKEFTIKDNISDIVDFIIEQNPDLLGFSTYIYNVSIIEQLLVLLSKSNFSGKIVLGGPEVSYNEEYFLRNFAVDFIVRNEGEVSFNKLIEALTQKTSLLHIPNLVFLEANQITRTSLLECDLTQIKPAHYLVEDKQNRIVYFEASRGCPFKCAYCMASLEKSVRFFPKEQTKQELLHLLKNNTKTIKFLDRSFNINPGYTHELFSFLKENDNQVTTIQFEVVLDLFKESEIQYILDNIRKDYFRFEVGIQSINTKTTDAVNRYQNFDKIRTNHQRLKGHVTMHLDLIAGLPYEDLGSFKNTFNQTLRLYPDELQLGFLKELKGTQISKTKDTHHYIFNQTSPYEVLENAYITASDLNTIKTVEDILEKYYNSHYMDLTMNYLLQDFGFDPFDFFHSFGVYLQEHRITLMRYQIHDLFIYLYDYLLTLPNISSSYVLFLLKQDYLSNFKNRPKIWWEREKSKQREEIFTHLQTNHHISLDILYRYAHIESYQNQYFVIVYQPNNTHRYLVKQ